MNFSNAKPYIFLIALGAFFFIPFLGNVHLFDWDECNFAECSREMIVTGDYFRPQIDYRPFWEKPPLFFWLQSASMHAFGINEFSARLVNALFGILTMIVVYLVGKRFFDQLFGLLWALSFLGSFLPHFFFKSGIIDPVFNLFIFLAVYFLAMNFIGRQTKHVVRHVALAGLFTGLAVLTKGPVALLLVVATGSVFWGTRRFKRTFTIQQVGVFAGVTLITTLAFYGTETILHGTWFMEEFIKYHIRLFSTGDAGHGRPFYFHFLVVLFGCFPSSFFAIWAFRHNHADDPGQRNFKQWMVILFWVVMILFSIVKTKTVLYSSLSWYPVTFLGAYFMHRVITEKQKWNKPVQFSLLIFGMLVAAVIAFFPILLLYKESIIPLIQDTFARENLKAPVQWSGWEALVGIVYGIAIFAVWILLRGNHFKKAFLTVLVASALCVQSFMIIFAPRIEKYTQGGPVGFYQRLSSEDCYVKPLFKTYAHLFYTRKKPVTNEKEYNREWLLCGPIDKPVFFVSRFNRKKYFLEKYPELEEIKTQYGFTYYLRNPTLGQ